MSGFWELSKRPPLTVTILAAIQWIAVTAASAIVVPITIGQAFDLAGPDTAALLQRTLMLVGGVSIVQVLFGHRLPIIEGPAGLWWAVFLVTGGYALQTGTPAETALSGLAGGLVLAGIILLVLAMTGMVSQVRKVFTPIVTGTYMLLLTLQLSQPFVEGILGIGYRMPTLDPQVAIVALVIAVCVFALSVYTTGRLNNFSILIGIAAGWVVFWLLGLTKPQEISGDSFFAIPQPLPWGIPAADAGIALTAAVTSIILLINLIASIEVTGKAAHEEPSRSSFTRGTAVSGLAHLAGGFFGTAGLVPLSLSAGFISVTRIASRFPFILATAGLAVLGCFPSVGSFLAGLPAPVGYAVLMTSFAKMAAFGLRDYQKAGFTEANLTIAALSLMVGVGVMFVAPPALALLPPSVQIFGSNGLIIGVILAIILEQLVFKRKAES